MNLFGHLYSSKTGKPQHGAYIFIVLLIAISFASLSISASPGTGDAVSNNMEWMIKNWETGDGLPDNSITAIAQTPDGYLWLGTFNGLVRFNGVDFKIFEPGNTPQLPSGGVVNLHVDKAGRLLVSTYAGLVMLEGTEWRTLPLPGTDFVRTFAERGNGDVLMTMFDGKVFEFSSGQILELPSPPGQGGVGYIGGKDEDGHWWVAQRGFIGRWESGKWVGMVSPPVHEGDSVCCSMARDGGMWLMVGAELLKLQHGVEVSRRTLPGELGGVWSVSEDSQGSVWIATQERGFYRVTAEGSVARWGAADGWSDSGRCVFEDREGDLWIGTNGDGLLRLTARRFQYFDLAPAAKGVPVRSLSADAREGMWAATYGKGLFYLSNSGAANFTPVEVAGITPWVQSVLADHAGRVWIGSFQGRLQVLDQRGAHDVAPVELRTANALQLFEDSRGRVWFSRGDDFVAEFDGKGFQRFVPEEGQFKGSVMGFAEDLSGALWVTSFDRVYRRNGEQPFVEVKDNSGRSIGSIVGLDGDQDGSMWLLTADRGLLRWKDGKLAHLDMEQGLPVSSLRGSVEDETGHFWITSGAKVVRVLGSELRAVADGQIARVDCQIFDASDGLPKGDFAGGRQPKCVRDAHGRLWFAMSKGVATIDPRRLQLNRLPPQVHVEEIAYYRPGLLETNTVAGRPAVRESEFRMTAPFDRTVTLPPGSHRIEIHYAVLSFSAPDKVRTEVKLEGLEAAWRTAEGRVEQIHDLQPGKYVFRVRAANSDGVWNEAGASLAFAISPFFWQTGWFRMLGWVGVGCEALLIIALLRALERRRRAKQALREQLQFEQLLSELSREFVNVPGENVEAEIEAAVRTIGEALEFDIAAFSTLGGGGPEGRVSVIWRRAGAKEAACERLEEELPWSTSELTRGRDVWLPRISNLPAEAERDRVTYSKYGVQSSYQVPVYSGGSVLAAFSLCAVGKPREMKRELLQRQRLIGEIFVNALTRKRAEERQRESEARFRIVADSAPVMIWMSGVDKRCTFFNKTWLDFTGRSLDQEMGNGWAEGVHRGDLESCLRLYGEAFDARKPFVLQYRLRRRDGEYRWVSDNGVARYDAEGEFAGYIGSCVDFTERKQAEEKFRLAVETSPNAILLVDERGGIVMANSQAEMLFGYTAQEFASRAIEELVPERYRGRHAFYRREFHASPQTREMGKGRDLFVRRKDGSEVEVEIALNPIHAQGEVFVLATIVDITERRRANLEVQNLRQELAHSSRVAIIGQLASSLAHELNQPLGAILRNAEAAELFLQDSNPDLEELRSIITDIRKDDQRAAGVIDRLRQLLKRREIEMQPLDAGKLADEVVPLLRPDALARRIALQLETSPDLPLVRGDRVQLQQVLLNLVLNAMDAVVDCAPDKRRVKLRIERDSNKFVAMAVSDSGHGVAADKLQFIFDPFFTTKPNGLGMGLSISKAIVEAHGGRLSARNNSDGGATFCFTVPVVNGGNGK